ncbi:hypothetical protein PoB_006245300 [Plakobranchus ocellatus]|uniref:Uncharacterized protein n=1 Tax=Plakobranchus ocellatus TaxID=259542 RepID=A0AAV4CVQ2_9GAST|nr:hypothetical protein PoB_006245300 [Plakobranchus ocellatus]
MESLYSEVLDPAQGDDVKTRYLESWDTSTYIAHQPSKDCNLFHNVRNNTKQCNVINDTGQGTEEATDRNTFDNIAETQRQKVVSLDKDAHQIGILRTRSERLKQACQQLGSNQWPATPKREILLLNKEHELLYCPIEKVRVVP